MRSRRLRQRQKPRHRGGASTFRIAGSEVFQDGKKAFLIRDGVLYTIRDRESNENYDEDEPWTFEHWQGEPASAAIQTEFNAFVKQTARDLLKAAEDGDLTRVKECIKTGISLDNTNTRNQTALYIAIRYDNVDVAIELIRAGADLEKPDMLGNTPLHLASEKNNVDFVDVVDELIAAGADINAVNKSDFTPLMMGIRNTAVVKMLIDAGADVNKGSPTPLKNAAYYGVIPTMRLLLDAGADPNLQNPLPEAARSANPAAVEMLIAAGANISAVNWMGYTPLYVACERGRLANVQLLIRAGADVNRMEANGMTPLLAAVAGGHMDVAAALIDANADFSNMTMMNRARSNANRRTLRNILAIKSGQVFTNLQAANNRLPPNVAAHVTEYVTGVPKRNNPAYKAQFRTRRRRRSGSR